MSFICLFQKRVNVERIGASPEAEAESDSLREAIEEKLSNTSDKRDEYVSKTILENGKSHVGILLLLINLTQTFVLLFLFRRKFFAICRRSVAKRFEKCTTIIWRI